MSEHRYEFTLDPASEGKGIVYVIIRSAERRSYFDRDNGRVEYLRPRVEVTTDPSYDVKDYVTLRGRKYRIDKEMTPLNGKHETRGPFRHARTGRLCTWTTYGTAYNGGYRNERGAPVNIDSPVDEKLDIIVDEVLSAFVKKVPDWERISERILHENEVASARGNVQRLRAQLEEAAIKLHKMEQALKDF